MPLSDTGDEGLPDPAPGFFDPARHVEALLADYSDALSAGRAERAFALMDRRCRLSAPEGRLLLLRAEASRRAGFLVEAREDLSLALADDPTDPAILNFALRFGASESQLRAARLTLAAPQAAPSLIAAAVDRLFDRGESFLFSLERRGAEIFGFAVWGGADDIWLRWGDNPTELRLVAQRNHWLATPKRAAADLRLPAGAVGFFRAGARIGGKDFSAAPVFADPALSPVALTVIVPVYEDFAATKTCFEALFAGGAPEGARIIAVDDASPNLPLRAWLDRQAAEGRLTLLRNPTNLGFAVAVNRALALCRDGDVILLNADTLAPPGALARLTAIARAGQVGTATPLSNNGEDLSFPAPFKQNPLPDAAEIARLDALAALANGDAAIDIPNGVGFCLYISRACLDAVGPLPERYERGYYEDVEFCLRARARNFRTVAVPGVYVGHAGSLSFRDDKRALVRRNLVLLEQRFARYVQDGAAFFEIDPLRAARGAIEIFTPPQQPSLLLVAATPLARHLARQRAKSLAKTGPAPLLCLIEKGEAHLRGPEGAMPQSLAFPLDRLEDLAAFLASATLVGVEIYDALALSPALLASLRRLGRPLTAVAGALDWVVALRPPVEGRCLSPETRAPCAHCAATIFSDPDASAPRRQQLRRKRALLSRATIAPLDALAEKLARQIFPGATAARPPVETAPAVAYLPPSRNGALALLAPLADPAAEKFIRAFAAAIGSRRSPRVILFGAAIDPLGLMKNGALFVAGPVAEDEWPRLIRQYRIAAVGSPYRGALFGPLDQLARRFSLPKLYFDYSFGAAAHEKKDLALDPRLCDAKAAAQAAGWLLSAQTARPLVRIIR